MTGNEMFLLKRGCGALELEDIVKDIQEKKDNAIAMEFTKCIGEFLRKNGVVPKISEYRMENHAENHAENKIEMRYGVSIDELDFSEHDKVFEDKIEKLEKQIKIYESHKKVLRTRCMESARDKFDKKMYGCLSIVSYPKEIENENKALKQRIVELEKELEEWKEEARVVKKQRDEQLKSFRKAVEPYVDILHMHETIAELKQRIAELENENKNLNIRIFQNEAYGDKKPTKINLNDRIKVKLTPLGAEIYYHQYDDIHKDYPKMKKHLQSSLPKVDENGYTEFQLWHFMELYGEHIGMCKPNVISPLDIVVSE